jgi:D-lactate dehydrogenase
LLVPLSFFKLSIIMKLAIFNTKPYDRRSLSEANANHQHQLHFFDVHLSEETVSLAHGFPAICSFVNDILNRSMLEKLAAGGTKYIALRCAGFNQVDLEAAEDLGIKVVRVPAYSPYAVAEHAVALILSLNRKIYRAYNRIRESNFSLEGLLGFDLHGCTVGVVGTGIIGALFCKIMQGFGCRVLACDAYKNPDCISLGVEYLSQEEVFRAADIISLHCPLTPSTYHLIDDKALAQMKDGVMIVNTSRGALVDAQAVIEGLKSGKISSLALDVYEEEGDLFFEDLSGQVIQDDVFARLMTFPNVLITGHQAFFTKQALENIAQTTLANISELEATGTCRNLISSEVIKA